MPENQIYFAGEKSVGIKGNDFTPSGTVREPPAAFSEASLAAVQMGSVRKVLKEVAMASLDSWMRK